jgi:bifunctional ADP-heptose synthase (sugar kinase/adenylyltransferase)
VDTRKKLVDRADALRAVAELALTVVTGYFDPLTSAHARRLEEIASGGARLLIVVRTPPNPILDARARAELVAALAAVRYVVVEEGDAAWTRQLPGVRLIHEEEADLQRTRDLIAQVHRRQAAG